MGISSLSTEPRWKGSQESSTNTANKSTEVPRRLCLLHSQRGNAVCTNSLLIPREQLERELLRGL